MRLHTYIIAQALLLAGVESTSHPSASVRNNRLAGLLEWAKESDIEMHPSLGWKSYDNDDFGFQLTKPLPRKTVLLSIPRSLVLDANILQEEAKEEYDNKQLESALSRLGDYALHQENFFIFLQLLKCRQHAEEPDINSSNSKGKRWIPWVKAMPPRFAAFTKDEQGCLPFYAKYASEYQDLKFQAFVRAAAELGACPNIENTDDCLLSSICPELEDARWAFQAVNSRFWKTAPTQPGDSPTSELVPIGDMFNHKEPHNVDVIHDPKTKAVQFVYSGSEEDGKDLFITYGQPSNPHRFLAIFGFVPTNMKEVWCHLAYNNNPYADDVPKMVIDVKDGTVAQQVWDAIMYELSQPAADEASQEKFRRTLPEKSMKYKKLTTSVLMTHIQKQLDELASLRQKIETDLEHSPNKELIVQHNEFLTAVFQKAKDKLLIDR